MSTLKLRFDADLPFQRHAMDAVTSLFTGQPLAESALSVSFSAGPLALNEYGSGNRLVLDQQTLFANLAADLAYSMVDPRIRVGRRRR